MTALIHRYRAGEHEQVWAELLYHGPNVRQEPLYSEALDVARETMMRAKANVEVLRHRLDRIGYRFAYPDEVIVPPQPDTRQVIDRLERRVGPLPLSLRAWYEIVGSVNFIGSHPEWDEHMYADPLVVDPIAFAIEEYREWKESCAEYGSDEMPPYAIPIAPDEYHKAQVVGRPQYSVAIYTIPTPNPGADAILGDEPHHTTFVNYLRTCFRWGGFPGLEHAAQRPDKHLTFLTKGLRRL